MLPIMTHYSGLAAMLVAWLTIIIFPLKKFEVQTTKDTISTTVTKDKQAFSVVTTGLVVGAIFQALFIVYLLSKLDVSILYPAIVLYVLMCIATLGTAIFPVNRFPKLHLSLALSYFSIAPFSILAFGLLSPLSPLLKLISFICATAYILGFVVFVLLFKKAHSISIEIYAFSILSIWTIGLTFL